MNKIECHNCLSSKRQFYVYTICRHFLCLKCTFCLVNIQANAIRCCYQYTPISQQLKQILDQQIQVRLKTSQNQKNSEPQIKSDFSFKAETVQKNKKYFFSDSIKQQQSDERVNMNIQQKESKIESIYIKDPYISNKTYSHPKNFRSSKQQLRNIQNRIEIKQKQQKQKQKIPMTSLNINTQIFQQNLMKINMQIQRQKEIIHESFKNYHEELKIRQKQAISKLYQITQNNWKNNEKPQHFTTLTQQKQNQRLYIQKIQTQHHLTDKITTKLDHFKNILKERLIKHYI